jgi:hypothetical protein
MILEIGNDYYFFQHWSMGSFLLAVISLFCGTVAWNKKSTVGGYFNLKVKSKKSNGRCLATFPKTV